MSKFYLGSINLSKVNKKDIFTAESGNKFLNISIWINDEPDKYGNHIAIKAGGKDASYYIGNAKDWKGTKKTDDDPDDLPW